MDAAFILLAIFGPIFGTIVMLSFFKNRRIERTALIAAGKEASIFNQGEKKTFTGNNLKFAILFVGEGIALLIGNYLAENTGLEEAVAYLSMIFLLGGLSLLCYYLIQKKLNL
ncbi:hypothetical protein E9993_21880 [Labilibacter sediminis]|nr:hypothetical protein E9993_21880 [Labilibacter sediminis]